MAALHLQAAKQVRACCGPAPCSCLCFAVLDRLHKEAGGLLCMTCSWRARFLTRCNHLVLYAVHGRHVCIYMDILGLYESAL